MIRQGAISVTLDETDAAVTKFPGVVPLTNLGPGLGLFDDLDRFLPQKERNRGLPNSAAKTRMGDKMRDMARLLPRSASNIPQGRIRGARGRLGEPGRALKLAAAGA